MPLYALTCIAFRPSTNLKYEKKTRRSWSRRGEHSIWKPPLPSKLGRSPLTLLQYPPQSGVCRRNPRPDSRRRKKPSATGCLVHVATPTIPLTCTSVRSATRLLVAPLPHHCYIRVLP